jgi:hypothetical protein
MTTLGIQYQLKVCVDCAMLIANGEPNPDWTEDEHDAHVAQMNSRWPGDTYHLTVGDDVEDFSRSWCDCCGSTLHGTRVEAHAFLVNN